MLSEADRKQAADILMTAEKERKQAVRLTKTFPDITFEDAYAISTEVANRKIAAGAKLIGHKVGLTSKAMQRSSMIDEPDYGHLLDNMMIADGAKIPHENYCKPRVEVELAFVLGKRLKGPGVGLTDVLSATEYVVPAIEIAMGRFAEIRAVEAEVADLEERFASRKAVDQAKGLLQEGLGLSEPEAFRWIQKTAMDLRKSMREVAEGVIDHAKAGGKPRPLK